MSALDVENLLGPVTEDVPCGEDLEYDPEFGELERAAQGTPEQSIGDEIKTAEEPKWSDVAKQATALMARTKDLRVAVHLTNAVLHTEGLSGFNDGLGLVQGLMTEYWDDVHPKLDEEDDNDPTMRMNTLMTLSDTDAVLKGLREAPIVSSRAAGVFSLRDMRLASGEIQAGSDDEIPDSALIDAAFLDCELDDLQASGDAVSGALTKATEIDAFLTEKVGSMSADLNPLISELKAANFILGEQLVRRGVGEAPSAEGGPGGAPGTARPISGEINTREDVVRVLDKMCDYFKRNEPSSPVPLLLQRAKRLVAKDFLEILRDLTPDGVHQAENIGGIEPE